MAHRYDKKHETRWVFVVELQCYAIGYHEKDHWNIVVPMCYASSKLIKRLAGVEIDPDAIVVKIILEQDKFDYQKVIPGALVECDFTEPSGWSFSSHDIPRYEAGKLTINGQTVYGETKAGGMIWTPVRPDMGAVDMYDIGNLHDAVAKNLFGDEATTTEFK